MITKTEYLKNLTDMTTDEKLLLLDRVEQWQEAYPSLRASVTSWEDAPVKDFDEGILLCSCLRQARSFVEKAYYFNATRCLEMIRMTLDEVVRIARPGGPRTESEKKERPIKAFVPKSPQPDEDGRVRRISEAARARMEEEAMEKEAGADKWRPQNLNSYMHLLPAGLQQECRTVKQKYYLPLHEARARLESLCENPDATKEQRAEMAGKLVEAEDALAAFWEKVDKAYRQMTGHDVPEEPSREKKLSEFTKEDIENIADEEKREGMKLARIENNKKYLRRTDLPEGEETRSQLLLRARELHEWGIKITGRQEANMQKFGVPVPSADKAHAPAEVKEDAQQKSLFDGKEVRPCS